MKLIKKLIPDYALIPLICLVILQIFTYCGTKFLVAGMVHHNFESSLDLAIPFLPWTVVIYTGSYLYWVVNVLLSVRFDKDRAYRFLCADFLSKFVCIFCFLLVPTTNTRPEITGTGFFDQCMRLVYYVDSPENLFPSIHCLLSWMCYLGVRGEKRIPKGYRIFSLVFTLVIFVSTLTTKQHIVPDVFFGWLTATVCYGICANKKIVNIYRSVFERK